MDKTQLMRGRRHLRKCDPLMSDLIQSGGSIDFTQTRQPHFHALVRAIVDQQLSVKAGRTIQKRLLDLQGMRYFNAQKLISLSETDMRCCGLSGNKVRYIRTLAQAIVDGQLNFRKLVRKTNIEISSHLIHYPGIGQWTVDMFLMSSLQRLDVFPVGDLVIRKRIQHYYGLTEDASYSDYDGIAEIWAPYRSIASFYLWRSQPQVKR